MVHKTRILKGTLIVVDFKINYKISNKLFACLVLFVYKCFVNKSPTNTLKMFSQCREICKLAFKFGNLVCCEK